VDVTVIESRCRTATTSAQGQIRRKQGVTDATIKRNLIALSSVANFAIDEGYWEENPVLPRLKRNKEHRDPIILPRPEDLDKVIAQAPGRFANMNAAARATSARQKELAGAVQAVSTGQESALRL
jgi:integrase/recombinase XerD